MRKLNNRRVSLVNAVQRRLQEKIRGIYSSRKSSPASSPRKEDNASPHDDHTEDLIPPYAPSESETTGKMISPPEELAEQLLAGKLLLSG